MDFKVSVNYGTNITLDRSEIMYMKGGKTLYYKYRVMVTNQAVIILKRYLIVIAHNPGKNLIA